MSQICTVSDFFHQSPVRCVVLKEMIESWCPGADHTVFNNVCRTRRIARLDTFDFFCDLLTAIQAAIERIAENVDGKYSRNKAEKAKPLFMSTCPFQTIVKAVMVSMVIHKRSYQEAARF